MGYESKNNCAGEAQQQFLAMLFRAIFGVKVKKNGKGIPVTGCGSLQGCETPRLPHFLDKRLKDGGQVGRLMCRTPFTHQE
jgi:hypothetical protein